MAVKVRLSSVFTSASGGHDVIEMPAKSPIECLQDLQWRFPESKRWFFDRQGKLLRHLWFFVNGRRVFVDDLNTPLNDGDELIIVLAIGGG